MDNILLSEKEGDQAPVSWAYTITGTNLPMRSKLEGIFVLFTLSLSGGSMTVKTHFMGGWKQSFCSFGPARTGLQGQKTLGRGKVRGAMQSRPEKRKTPEAPKQY